jgi:large subunit ribosomal protein L31e
MKAPRHERAKRATKALKAFLSRHMKSEDISLDRAVNEKIWERGMKNPPHHIEVSATKDDDGKVTVILAPQVTVRGKAVKAKPAPAPKKEPRKPAKDAEEAPETAETAPEAEPNAQAPVDEKAEKQAAVEAKAKAPIPTEPADQLAPKAPKPRQNRSPESSQGTKGQ